MTSRRAGRWSYFGHFWRLRFFLFSLVGNDIVHRYRRSILGIGWSLLRPLAMTMVLCIVFGSLFNLPTAEYAPYLIVSLAVWQYIHESIVAGALCFTNSAAYIRQQRVPLAIYSARAVLSSGFHFLVGLSLASALTIYFKGMPHPIAVLAIVPSVLLLFVFCWAAATIVGLVQAHFRDASHLLEIGMQILFYLTPIVYKMDSFPRRRDLLTILELNPIASLLEVVRHPILEGSLPPLRHIQIAVAVVTTTALLAWVCLRKLERTLVFWL